MGRGDAAAPALTRRQREIASLISEGLTDQAIAKRLFLSTRTVEGHVLDVRNKLGFENRTQIASWVARQAAPRAGDGAGGGDDAGQPVNNLPAHLTAFVGRHRELASLERILRSSRLVTITGPGGSGKTRLAQQLAADLMRRYGAIWFVDLSTLSDPRLVAAAVAATLGAAQIEADSAFDNCEHLVDACGQLAEGLLHACPELTLVCTSREPLRVVGERAWRLAPLALPAPGVAAVDRALESDAVRLFVDRAQLVDPAVALDASNVDAVVRLVQRLDGLPLALELAAGHLGGMSVRQLWRHIDDHFVLTGRRGATSRQRTLAATIAWSHDLLTDDERRHFRRLAAFRGHFSLEAAGAVTAVAGEEPIGLGVLSALIDKSLVLAPLDVPDRYRLLNTIREYGLDRLREAGELDAVRARHHDFFSDLARTAARELRGPRQAAWLGQVEQAHDDLRAAFDHAIAHETGSAVRLALSLERFWFVRGHLSEGRQRIETALDRDQGVTRERATALVAAAKLAWRQGEVAAFETYLDESLAIARRLEDVECLQMCLTNLGTAAAFREDFGRARALYEESLEMAGRRADERGVAFLAGNLGIVATLSGEHDAAASWLRAALATLRALDDQNEIANALINLGAVEVDRGRPAAARAYYRECLAILQVLGETVNVAECLEGIACVIGAGQQVERALTLESAAAAIRETSGASPSHLGRRVIEPRLERLRAARPAATVRRLRRAGARLSPEQAIELALSD